MLERLTEEFTPLIGAAIILVVALTAGLLIHLVAFKVLDRVARHTKTTHDEIFLRHCRRPARWLIVLLIVHLQMPLLKQSAMIHAALESLFSPLLILAVAWLAVRLVLAAEEMLQLRFDISRQDNLRARKLVTQIGFLKKIALVVVGVFAVGSILMTFEGVRELGTSILASAGVIGIIVGFAAQRSIGTMLAGLQIAFTQPIRIDDVVIVENEWGRIEEITLTYVVVRIWDLRRLVVPISHFIERPFQNWTRVSADILGTVFIHADYTLPVEILRAELRKILEKEEKWDGKVCVLQVTDAKDRTLELRALVSAEDASRAWDLRCSVREKLIEFIRENYPESLPRFRAEVGKTGPPVLQT